MWWEILKDKKVGELTEQERISLYLDMREELKAGEYFRSMNNRLILEKWIHQLDQRLDGAVLKLADHLQDK